MFKCPNHEYECTRKCKLRSHGNNITAALTKRSIVDDKLSAFVAKSCCNFADVVDDLGRSAVHLAASVDRYYMLEWLLNQGAKINGHDFESGSTPLHRALYYGCIDCAVLLLRYGASLDADDADTYCPLQNICRLMDQPPNQSEVKSAKSKNTQNEILVWGSNKNYNLGIGSEENPTSPQAVDFFRKTRINVVQVAMGTFHTLFLDSKFNLYAAGHGKGGRLGNHTESSLPAPKKVKVPIKNAGEYVSCISVSSKHSLLLTNRSTVFACGLNEDKQLGVRGATEKLTVFKEVIALRDFGVENLLGVIARDQYSLAFSAKCVYYWGRNVGQFGIVNGPTFIATPTQLRLPANVTIKNVRCNNAAIVILLTENSKVLVYYNGSMKTKDSPYYVPIKDVCLHGGDSGRDGKGSPSALKLLLLDERNSIYFWYENTKLFYRCKLTQIPLTRIDKILYKRNKVLILSEGNVYEGKCKHIELIAGHENDSHKSWISFKMSKVPSLSTEHTSRIELSRLPNVDRVLDIFSNEEFNSFAVLQENSYKYFKVPTLDSQPYEFRKLYGEVNEDDAVHDVVFHVAGCTYAAHKLLIFARAPGLRDIVQQFNDEHVHLNIDLLTGKMFELILKFIYLNYYPNNADFEEISQSLGYSGSKNIVQVYEIFLNHVEKFNMTNLANYVKATIEAASSKTDNLNNPNTRFPRINRTDYDELYDVRILCTGDTEIPAHKCMLIERLEYFDMMFTHTWAEQSVVSLTTIPLEYMQTIVDFIYSGDEEYIRRQNYSESFLYSMIVLCDQFLFERLRQVCELLLVEKITLRKCGEMLDFSCIYNCELLRTSCMDFICQNLSRVLTYRTLENCEPESLRHINAHYRRMFPNVEYRKITPNSEAIDDDLLLCSVEDFIVDMNYRPNENEKNSSKSRTTKVPLNSITRQHEREAISSMMKSLNDNANVVEESHEIVEKLQEKKEWNLVADKKSEQKKKQNWRDVTSSVGETLADKNPEISMETRTPTKTEQLPILNQVTPSSRALNLADLADFTPPREKLSQKQRKRLSSTSNVSPPVNIPLASASNAWGVISPPSAWDSEIINPTTGTSIDPDSFANKLRISTSPSQSSAGKNLLQIQREERKEREQYERLRNKSLALTQIEETAIAELKAFYNVDNVTDEIITIERKPTIRSTNFTIWQKN